MTLLGTVCTTIRVCNGSPEFWSLHKERLRYFSIVLSRKVNLGQIETEVLLCAKEVCEGTLRVEIDRHGSVRLNYRPVPKADILKWHKVYSNRPQSEAVIKWLNRECWNREKERKKVDVLVLLDDEQHYLECCIGNVFVYRPREQKWYTPGSSKPLLPGIMRSVLLSYAEVLGESIIESDVVFEDTDKLWMSNALRGLCPLNVKDPTPPIWSLFNADPNIEEKALGHFRQVLSHP